MKIKVNIMLVGDKEVELHTFWNKGFNVEHRKCWETLHKERPISYILKSKIE